MISTPALGWQDRFLDALRQLGIVVDACRAAGVGHSTVYKHRDKDPVFADAWSDAEDEAAVHPADQRPAAARQLARAAAARRAIRLQDLDPVLALSYVVWPSRRVLEAEEMRNFPTVTNQGS